MNKGKYTSDGVLFWIFGRFIKEYLYTFCIVSTKVHIYFNLISLTQGFGLDPYRGYFHAKNLDSYSHCLHQMFGQMAGC
uniref:hypothetical protein n=1 Tax=Candidatus Cryptobacteroides bacterium TaxID=3085639 RepID=UPI004026748B